MIKEQHHSHFSKEQEVNNLNLEVLTAEEAKVAEEANKAKQWAEKDLRWSKDKSLPV